MIRNERVIKIYDTSDGDHSLVTSFINFKHFMLTKPNDGIFAVNAPMFLTFDADSTSSGYMYESTAKLLDKVERMNPLSSTLKHFSNTRYKCSLHLCSAFMANNGFREYDDCQYFPLGSSFIELVYFIITNSLMIDYGSTDVKVFPTLSMAKQRHIAAVSALVTHEICNIKSYKPNGDMSRNSLKELIIDLVDIYTGIQLSFTDRDISISETVKEKINEYELKDERNIWAYKMMSTYDDDMKYIIKWLMRDNLIRHWSKHKPEYNMLMEVFPQDDMITDTLYGDLCKELELMELGGLKLHPGVDPMDILYDELTDMYIKIYNRIKADLACIITGETRGPEMIDSLLAAISLGL